MKKKPFLIVFISLIVISCGRKAPPLPPIVKIPQTIENVKIKQTGTEISLLWQNPDTYTDGSPLTEIKEIYIYVLKKDKNLSRSLSEDDFLDEAQLIRMNESQFSLYSSDNKKFIYSYPLSERDLNKAKLIFGFKIKDYKNKLSNLSKLISIEPGIPPPPPQNITFSLLEDKILLKWDPPKKRDDNATLNISGYIIYRWEKEEKIPLALNSTPVRETSFEDNNFLYDQTYYYSVRSIAYSSFSYIPLPYPILFLNLNFLKKKSITKSLSSSIESENSNVIEITPKDTFPPRPPKGLLVLPEEKAITLIWDPNLEKDLEGYRVWKKSETDKNFSLLTPEPILDNSYRDDMIEENVTYFYYITAVDKKKNESDKSNIIKVKISKS